MDKQKLGKNEESKVSETWGFSVECEGGEEKSGSKVTSAHVGLQGITAGDEAQTA